MFADAEDVHADAIGERGLFDDVSDAPGRRR